MPKHTRAVRKLRQNSTDAERTLWNALRTSDWPWKFRRQHPIGDVIADFACVSSKLVIELDGGQQAVRPTRTAVPGWHDAAIASSDSGITKS